MFRHEFLKALGRLNGVEGYAVDKILEPQQVVRNPRQAQDFVNDVMRILKQKLHQLV